MYQSWLGAVTSKNGSEYGVVRRFFRFGLVRPARLRMLGRLLVEMAVLLQADSEQAASKVIAEAAKEYDIRVDVISAALAFSLSVNSVLTARADQAELYRARRDSFSSHRTTSPDFRVGALQRTQGIK
jgi:hypothetical protein